MVQAKNVPNTYWAKAMRTLSSLSPFEKLWNKKPSVGYFRVFGCVYYALIPNHLRTNIDQKAINWIFVGFESQRKGQRCDATTVKCYCLKIVVFDEAFHGGPQNKMNWQTQPTLIIYKFLKLN